MANNLKPTDNKFHQGNGHDGKHYWLTPTKLMEQLQLEFNFDCDACPFPKPDDFDGLTSEWGKSTYVNPPFGSIMHQGPTDKKAKKKGMTAWVRKAIEENKKGKRVVMVYPIDKWVLMLVAAGAKITNLGDVKWIATEDGSEGNGTGRHIAQFVLEPSNPIIRHNKMKAEIELRKLFESRKKGVQGFGPTHYELQEWLWARIREGIQECKDLNTILLETKDHLNAIAAERDKYKFALEILMQDRGGAGEKTIELEQPETTIPLR